VQHYVMLLVQTLPHRSTVKKVRRALASSLIVRIYSTIAVPAAATERVTASALVRPWSVMSVTLFTGITSIMAACSAQRSSLLTKYNIAAKTPFINIFVACYHYASVAGAPQYAQELLVTAHA
jgi:hypothetical protein